MATTAALVSTSLRSICSYPPHRMIKGELGVDGDITEGCLNHVPLCESLLGDQYWVNFRRRIPGTLEFHQQIAASRGPWQSCRTSQIERPGGGFLAVGVGTAQFLIPDSRHWSDRAFGQVRSLHHAKILRIEWRLTPTEGDFQLPSQRSAVRPRSSFKELAS